MILKMQNESAVDERPDYSEDEQALLAQKEFVVRGPKKSCRHDQQFRMADGATEELQYDVAEMNKHFG